MFCADYGNGLVSSCHGDSGGPVVVKEGGKFFVTGVVSFGDGCGSEPDVYTKVANYIKWIDESIEEKMQL